MEKAEMNEYLEMLKYAEHNQLAQFNLGIMGDERYGPETVRAQSLGELRWAVEEKIENDVGQVISWSDD